mmetsp:Transcript_13661/g.21471  ORF Transcript_13661/g.21471 Transcript_13661/m.21471 type:complete len:565 (-) Transcript_13661:51-1745(-)
MAARKLRLPFFPTPCEATINDATYIIKEKVDNGSFGQVYLAHPSGKPDHLVAVKIMSRDRIEQCQQEKRIEEEIKLHSQVDRNNIEWPYNTPGIVELYSYDRKVSINHKLYECLVMEYCEGCHLNQYLRSHPSDRLTEIESFYFFQQMICSLECLHKQRVIHRDIKPQNLLLSNTSHSLPILKLCDFGLGKKLSRGRETTHSLCGTPNYIAPEIICHEGHSYAVDMWSAGIVLYIMLVNQHTPPFETGHVSKTMKRVKTEHVQIPKYLTPQCQSFLSLIFNKNQWKRVSIEKLRQHDWWKSNARKLHGLLQEKLMPLSGLKYLANIEYKLSELQVEYVVNQEEVQLLWGVDGNAEGFVMSVEKKTSKKMKKINITHGGITTKQYTVHTLPIGFYDKYLLLQQLTQTQIAKTPLIAISIRSETPEEHGMDDSDENSTLDISMDIHHMASMANPNTTQQTKTFNTKHYVMFTRSESIEYSRTDTEINLLIRYERERNEYTAYLNMMELDLLKDGTYADDLALLKKLKRKIWNDLYPKYCQNRCREKPEFTDTVILEYTNDVIAFST